MFKVLDCREGEGIEYTDNPRQDAYRYAAMLKIKQRRRYEMTFRPDGSITVTGAGLMPITFKRG